MFGSDTITPAHPAMIDAIARANAGRASSYGADPHCEAATALLRDVFETSCGVFFIGSGTAANGLALAALTPPWGAVVAHRHAHIIDDEAGAPEFFTGGARVLMIDAEHGLLSPAALDAELSRYSRGWVHGAQPFAVSISNLSESGASYSVEHLREIGAVCRARGVKLHMDGARFANAIVGRGAAPAEASWRAGVDVLSFGATKNGALGVDVIVCFDPAAQAVLPHLCKRAGQLPAKQRFFGAQIQAYLRDNLWLTLAAHANEKARALAGHLEALGGQRLHPVDGNEVFVRLAPSVAEQLRAAGVGFMAWTPDGADAYRFVTAWSTTDADVAIVASLSAAA